MKELAAIVLLIVLSACGPQYGLQGNTGAQGPAGPQGPGALTPSNQTVAQIVANENSYRLGLGETILSQGLSCTVQAVASGQWLSSSSPGYNSSQGVLVLTGPSYSYLLNVGFDQPNSGPGPNAVIDPSIQPLFENNNYRIVCSGQLVVTSDGYHEFDMSSDDGAILTIDGTQVINNDGNHGITTASGTKNLRSDIVHTFSVQYAQSGAGNFALILNMDGSLLPAVNLYH